MLFEQRRKIVYDHAAMCAKEAETDRHRPIRIDRATHHSNNVMDIITYYYCNFLRFCIDRVFDQRTAMNILSKKNLSSEHEYVLHSGSYFVDVSSLLCGIYSDISFVLAIVIRLNESE